MVMPFVFGCEKKGFKNRKKREEWRNRVVERSRSRESSARARRTMPTTRVADLIFSLCPPPKTSLVLSLCARAPAACHHAAPRSSRRGAATARCCCCCSNCCCIHRRSVALLVVRPLQKSLCCRSAAASAAAAAEAAEAEPAQQGPAHGSRSLVRGCSRESTRSRRRCARGASEREKKERKHRRRRRAKNRNGMVSCVSSSLFNCSAFAAPPPHPCLSEHQELSATNRNC